MNRYVADRGVQANAATAVVLGVCTALAYSPPLLAVWAAWAGVTAWAVSNARRRRGHA